MAYTFHYINPTDNPVEVLQESWDEIRDNIRDLYRYGEIDDQVELDIIWKICEELSIYLQDKELPWNERIPWIMDIHQHMFYEEVCCDDPMNTLFHALCTRDEEFLAVADSLIRLEAPYLRKYAAEYYCAHGRIEVGAPILEEYLTKDIASYRRVMELYIACGRKKRAAELGYLALKKCSWGTKDWIFSTLIDIALESEDVEELASLYYRVKHSNVNRTPLENKIKQSKYGAVAISLRPKRKSRSDALSKQEHIQLYQTLANAMMKMDSSIILDSAPDDAQLERFYMIFARLKDREQLFLKEHYLYKKTYKTIAEAADLSPGRIGGICRKSIQYLCKLEIVNYIIGKQD